MSSIGIGNINKWKTVNPFLLIVVSALFGIGNASQRYLEDKYSILNCLFFVLHDMCLFIFLYLVIRWTLKKLRPYFDSSILMLKLNNVINWYSSNTWKKIVFSFLILWLPLAVVRYPGLENGGVAYMFQQFLGMDTVARHNSPIIYEGVYINQHHPVVLTVFFGIFIKFGVMIGHPYVGMFLLSITLTVINACGWAYIFKTLRGCMNKSIWLVMFFIFLVNPYIISMNTYVSKDSIYSTVLSIFCVNLLCVLMDPIKKNKSHLLYSAIILPFIKNQGIYIVVISCLVLFIAFRELKKTWIKCIAFSILLYFVIFQSIVFPILKIAPSGKQMALSLFIQATGRTISENEIPQDEMEIIERVLPVEDWSVYVNKESSILAFQFNQQATNEEIIDYIILWIKQGLRYPASYLRAIFWQTNGYYSIDLKTVDWNLKPSDWKIDLPNGQYIGTTKLFNLNTRIYDFLNAIATHPRIRYFFNIAVAFWVIIMSMLIVNNRYVLWICPILVQWLTCIAGWLDGSGRYALSIYEMSFIILGTVISFAIIPDSSYEEGKHLSPNV